MGFIMTDGTAHQGVGDIAAAVFSLLFGQSGSFLAKFLFKKCKISQNMVLRICHSNSTFF